MAEPPVEDVRRLKLTVVGDGTVGKTCLLYAFKNGHFPDMEYIPTIFENTSVEMEAAGGRLELNLWDTAGQEAYEKLRLLIYPRTDVFLLCYAVDNPNSVNNVSAKWLPEIKHCCPSATILLVATKTDTQSTASNAVDRAQGRRLSRRLKLHGFQECSAKTGEGVQEVFHTAVQVTVEGQQHTASCASCSLQ